MTEIIKSTATKATNLSRGVADKLVVNFLGSILAKLPDGVAMLVGAILIGLSWIATGVFKFSTFDDGWNQELIQQIIDWATYLGYGAVGVEGVNSAMNARSPHEAIDGLPVSQTDVEKRSTNAGSNGQMRDVSRN